MIRLVGYAMIFDGFVYNFIYEGIVLSLLNCKERFYVVQSQIYLDLLTANFALGPLY